MSRVEQCLFSTIEKDIDNQGYPEHTCLTCGARNDQECLLSAEQKKAMTRDFFGTGVGVILLIAAAVGSGAYLLTHF